MKNKLIELLKELLVNNDRIDQVGIKVSIMENTAFLAQPKTIGEIGNIMEHVNAYVENPNEVNKLGVEKLIERIESKF